MNPFKKKAEDVPEICGYLDHNGQFFQSKKKRDESNYQIKKRFIEDQFGDKIDDLVRYVSDKGRYIDGNDHYRIHELRRILVELNNKGLVADIVKLYIEYKEQLHKLENEK